MNMTLNLTFWSFLLNFPLVTIIKASESSDGGAGGSWVSFENIPIGGGIAACNTRHAVKIHQKKFATSAVVNNVKMSERPAYGLAWKI